MAYCQRIMATNADRLMTMQEVADHLQVPLWTVRKWRAAGRGPAGFRVGRHVRYTREEVDRWVAEQRGVGSAA
jgi:excisionase family DNA binding protein